MTPRRSAGTWETTVNYISARSPVLSHRGNVEAFWVTHTSGSQQLFIKFSFCFQPRPLMCTSIIEGEAVPELPVVRAVLLLISSTCCSRVVPLHLHCVGRARTSKKLQMKWSQQVAIFGTRSTACLQGEGAGAQHRHSLRQAVLSSTAEL